MDSNVHLIKLLVFLLVSSFLVVHAQGNGVEKVTLQLLWKNQFEFAGYYVAKEKGFYKEAGLDVELLEYHNGIDIVKNVLNAKSDFGIAYSDVVLEDPEKIVLLGALLQSSAHVLISLKSSGIKRIEDFKGKRIMISRSARRSAAFIAMLHSKKVSLDDMQIIKPSYDINALVKNEADLVTSYVSNEVYTLEKEGIKYNVWNPNDYGFDLYNDILFTSKKELREHPKRVEAFKRASLRGWQYAFEHMDEAIDIILKKYNTQHRSRDALVYEAKTLKKLSEYGSKNFFTIDVHKLQRVRDIYNILGLVTKQESITKLKDMLYCEPTANELTQQEKAYLQKKKVITMCVDPDWMPFESYKDGKYVGMSADYFQHFKKFIGPQTEIQIVPTKNWNESLEFARERKCDILSLLMKTPERSKYLNFTKPYLKIPIVMATRMDAPFTADFHTLRGKRLALVKGYAFIEILRKQYPNVEIVEVKNLQDGLDKVAQGKVYGYVGSLATIGYAFQKQYTGELKIAGKFDGTWDLGVGVRDDDPLLLDIFNKAVASVDASQRTQILNHWLSIRYEKGVDYALLEKIVALFGVILLIVGYFYFKLKKLKGKLEELSLRDPLSNLYNRRYFNKISEAAFTLFQRNGQAFSIVMLDIDDFKKVNDTYGHKVGDNVIVSVAKVLQEQSRESDIVSRYGGEEFIILLRDTTLKGAKVLAEKIRTKIEKLHVDNVHITVSLGAAEVKKSDKSVEDVIKRADDALYVAKAQGKNQLVEAE